LCHCPFLLLPLLLYTTFPKILTLMMD
jgi:hypothetical protein